MPNSFSTARLMSIFVASRATSNTTTGPRFAGDRRLLRDERAADDVGGLHPSTSCSRSTAARVAMMRVVSITSRAVSRPLATSRDAGDVARRRAEVLVELHVDDERLAGRAEALQQLDRRLRLLLAPPCSSSTTTTAPSLQLGRERRPQRAALDLLRQRVVVAARLRREHRAAVPPERRPRRSDLRAAGALLLVGLLAAAAHERAVLGHVRAAPLGRVLPHDRFPDQIGLDRAGEHRVVQVDRPDLLRCRCSLHRVS